MTDRSNKREEVLLAARKVFAARGYAGASMRLIADEAGVTAMALYNYAPSKVELYELILGESVAALYAGFTEAIAGCGSLNAEIAAVFDYTHDALINDPEGLLFTSRLMADCAHPDLAHIELPIEAYAKFFGTITDRAVRKNQLAASDQAAFVVFVTTLLWGFMSIAAIEPDSFALSIAAAKSAVTRFLRRA